MQAPGQVQRYSGEGSEGWDALVQNQVTFNRVLEKVPEKVPGKVWEALVQGQVKFNKVPKKVPEKVGKALCRAMVQQGSGEGYGEGLGGFGAEPGQVQQGSGEGYGEGLGALVQSQVRFNSVPEKVPEKGAKPGQVQQGSGEGSREGSGEGSGRLWCRARSGSTGFRRRFRKRSGRLRPGSTGFAAI